LISEADAKIEVPGQLISNELPANTAAVIADLRGRKRLLPDLGFIVTPFMFEFAYLFHVNIRILL